MIVVWKYTQEMKSCENCHYIKYMILNYFLFFSVFQKICKKVLYCIRWYFMVNYVLDGILEKLPVFFNKEKKVVSDIKVSILPSAQCSPTSALVFKFLQ